MFDDVAANFYHNVVAAYDAYVLHRDAGVSGSNRHMRAAVEAATALFHFREHLPSEHTKTRPQAVAECPDYRLIADVANAAKHRVLDRPTSEGPPLVVSAEDIQEFAVITRYQDAEGEYNDARTAVLVKCADGVSRNLDSALTVVLNYWGAELKRLGITGYSARDVPEPPGSRFVARASAKGLSLEMVQGLRWKQAVQLLRFDAEQGRSEPIDLTGSDLQFRIYKPKRTIDVMATPADGSEAISCSLELSDQEATILEKLPEAAREAFVNLLLYEHRAEFSEELSESWTAHKRAKASSTDPS